MKILFSSFHNYLDGDSGAALSTRESLLTLAHKGNDVRTLCLSCFDSDYPQEVALSNSFARLGLAAEKVVANILVNNQNVQLFAYRFDDSGIKSTVLLLPREFRRVASSHQLRIQSAIYLNRLHKELESRPPDIYATYGGYWAARPAARLAQKKGVKTVFLLHNLSYKNPSLFEYFDKIVVPSRFAKNHYSRKLGVDAFVLTPLISADRTLVKSNSRRFLTFVNPSTEKGLYFFTGIALALNRIRPDIPIQVVESRRKIDVFRRIAKAKELNNLFALPYVNNPATFLQETRILLVPSLCEESFGRVVVEAGMNGIPALCSDRGALPEVADVPSLILNIPKRFTPTSTFLPNENEIAPWITLIIRLWDDASENIRVGNELKQSVSRYSEDVVAKETEMFFASIAESNGKSG